MRRPFSIAVATLAVLTLWSTPARAQKTALPTVSATATLTILDGTVHHVPVGSSERRRALDGMNLTVGDRLLTESRGVALITFLDGSTVTIEPRSDVTVNRADVGDRETGAIGIWISLGTVWARVARLFEPRPRVSLESNAYTATAHDGLIGAQRNMDGSFICWTTAGAVTVSGVDGRPLAVLRPGEKATLGPAAAPVTGEFAVNQSVLEITASGSVLPLLLMPDGVRVVGFVAPGVAVNQVFGSFSGLREGRYVIEVPAGRRGPFTLVLEGEQRGRYSIDLVGRHRREPVYQRMVSGTIAAGDRLTFKIIHHLDPRSPDSDPRSIAVQGVSVSPPRTWTGPLPGRILISPRESTIRTGG